MQHGGRACFPPQSTTLLDPSGKPRTVSWVPFLDSEHAFSLQDFARRISSLNHEAVDLGSNPSLLRVTLGKVKSEDLSLHMEDRHNNHCLIHWGVHTVIGAGYLLSIFPEPFPCPLLQWDFLPVSRSLSSEATFGPQLEANLEEKLYTPHFFSVLSSLPSRTPHTSIT